MHGYPQGRSLFLRLQATKRDKKALSVNVVRDAKGLSDMTLVFRIDMSPKLRGDPDAMGNGYQRRRRVKKIAQRVSAGKG